MELEQRMYPRRQSKMKMQVYTSLSAAGYTVKIDNINEVGAFVRSEHLPQANEIISFNVCNSAYQYLLSGSAIVKRVVEGDRYNERGFALEFSSLIKKEVLNTITQ